MKYDYTARTHNGEIIELSFWADSKDKADIMALEWAENEPCVNCIETEDKKQIRELVLVMRDLSTAAMLAGVNSEHIALRNAWIAICKATNTPNVTITATM